jgi:sulfane dehydrogenase subunit SoxC
MARRRKYVGLSNVETVAANGLLDRRALLGRGVAFAGAMGTGVGLNAMSAAAEPLNDTPWTHDIGDPVPVYQGPSKFANNVIRTLSNPNSEPRTSQSRAPLQLLEGTITPNGVFFSICHSGVPEIDPKLHQLVIHGLVKRPLVFTLESLLRYPLTTRAAFIECGGNSAPLFSPQPVQANIQALHGLVSCAEWTGVKLSTLLEETGIDPKAKWFIAEGADASRLMRSVPLAKGLDDAMIALYQNGEPLMPGNGYPMRLLLPGYEGNMNVKYVRRIKLLPEPAMSFWEARTYTAPLPNGKTYHFYFVNEVKSFITHPSPGRELREPGFYEISGIAYSGDGKITKVEVSADGGRSWAKAALHEPVLSKAFTRFRLPWHWNGGPVILQSRAWDDAGNVQPTRAQFVAERGELPSVPAVAAFKNHHFNAVMSWAVDEKGAVRHAYA